MNGRFIPVAVMKYDAWWTRRYGREYNPYSVGNAYDNSYVILVRDIPIAHFDTMEEAETASDVAKKAISMSGLGGSPSDEDHPLAQKEMDGYTERNIRGGINRAEEGNAPIQDPMELGEMANWTPLDGTPSLKRRKDAEDAECYKCGNQVENQYQGIAANYKQLCDGCIQHHRENCSHCQEVIGDVKNCEAFQADSPSATIPVNYPKHLQPDWQKTPASSKKMAKEMRQALETEDPAARHAALFAMQDKYGDYWNQQSFNDAFKKEMEGSEPSWVKPLATALGFTLGFLGIHEIKKVL